MEKLFSIFLVIFGMTPISFADDALRIESSETCFFGFCSKSSSTNVNTENITAKGKITNDGQGSTLSFNLVSLPRKNNEDVIKSLQLPKMIGLHQLTARSNNKIIYGGLTEVSTDIYIVARHVWMGSSFAEIENTLPEIGSVRIYEIIGEANLPFDILLITPLPLQDVQQRLQTIIEKPKLQTKWVSWQFGNDSEKSTNKMSWGLIQETIQIPHSDQVDFSLSTNSENLTAPASSGSVVWSYNNKSEIAPLGMITCMKKIFDQRALRRKFPYVISFDRIFGANSFFREIRLEESLTPVTIERERDCDPIDGRAAGGD
ncbi:MAG: hypothetical protein ACXVCP_05600 [Bdellovibrio sp.]